MNLIRIILDLCSPAIRAEIKKFLYSLKTLAASTENDVDDIAVQALFSILGFPYKEDKK